MLFPVLVMPRADLIAQETVSAAPSGGPADPAEVEAFMDGLMAAHLRDTGIAGATVAIVRDGGVLLAKGYGLADVSARAPVDPARTLFRIGSVTKLLTATALMRLVEEGRLDLDADVNGYLDFQIPATFPEPITVKHLLTHTAGFEDDLRLLFTYEPRDILPLREWLIRTMPTRVRSPGVFAAYSNYGLALGGYVVERISGMSWDEYLERNILLPVGMTRTTGRQPLPAALEHDMSSGYTRQRGGWTRRRWEIVTGAAPAGSISSTALDMTRFMLVHLAGGAVDGTRILAPETVRRMHARHFAHDPRLPGFALGFYEMSSHGLRIIGHFGNTAWFHSFLALIPESQIGIFVSFNTDTAAPLTYGPFLTAFLDHYFPGLPPRIDAAPDFDAHVDGLTGIYRFNRLSYSSFQKAAGLGAVASVEAIDGTLLVRTPLGEMRVAEEAPLLFREQFGHGRVAFRTDDSGRGTHVFVSLAPMFAFERVPWHGLPALHFSVLGGGVLLFVGILITGIVRSLREWRGMGGAPARDLVLARRAMALAAAAHLGFVVSLAMLAINFDLWEFFAGPMRGLKVALTFPVIGVAATVGALAALGVGVRRDAGSRWERIRLGCAVIVGLLFAWSLNYWNLLGWRF
jgi:CubicO group peptidase (beta-lactamase class C family)